MSDDARDRSADGHAATAATVALGDAPADATGATLAVGAQTAVGGAQAADATGATVAADPRGAARGVDVGGETVAASGMHLPIVGGARAPRPTTHFIRGRELARGGMGRVVLAEDNHLERTVALKLLQRVSPAFRARFEREAYITAKLAHPAIVPIYDAGELADGEPFYAMKLVEGTPLDDTIAHAKDLPSRLALLPRAMAVCEALAYAHSKRIIHRDLKPANVLVGKFGETVVIDWGLAKDLTVASSGGAGEGASLAPADAYEAHSTDSAVTLDGQVVGTPSYMPPEQALGGTVDERTDVYALGALLFHVVAGRPPYLGRTAGEILAAVTTGPPPGLATVEPAVPDDLATIIGKAMARAPADRYPTAGELADDLRGFIDGRLVASHRYTGAELVRRWLRRHRAAVSVGVAAVGVLALGGALSVHSIFERERETRRALAESQLEHGRQLLVDGDPGRAAPYLVAAYAELPDDPIARRLAVVAVRDLSRRIARLPGTAATFRADGGELAIARADGAIGLVDPDTGQERKRLSPPPDMPGEIAQLAYSPDGKRLAVASQSGEYIRDVARDDVSIVSHGAATEVRAVGERFVFVRRADGVVALVGSSDHTLAEDRVEWPEKLAVSSDGASVAVVSHDRAFVWRTSDLTRIREVPPSATHYSALPEADDVLTAGEDGVRRWSGSDAADVGTPLLSAHAVSLAAIADHVVLADERIVHTDTGAVTSLARESVEAVAVIDRTHAMTGGYHRVLHIWDLEHSAQPAAILDAEAATHALVADPSGRRIVSRGALSDARVELWDTTRLGGPTHGVDLGARVDMMVGDRAERLAVHTGGDTTELRSAALEHVATLRGWPVAFRPSHDEVWTGLGGVLIVSSSRDGHHIQDLTAPGGIARAAASPSGALIATASDSHVTVRDAQWNATRDFDVGTNDMTILGIDDRGRVITGHASGLIHIWDGRTGAALATAVGHTATVSAIDVRDGTFVTNSWDLTTRQWDTTTGALRVVVKRFDRGAYDVQLSPDQTLIASVDGDAMIDLWDAAQGRLIARYPTHAEATQAEFIDNDHLAVGDVTGRLEVFDISVPARTPDDVARALAAGGRWELVDNRATERP